MGSEEHSKEKLGPSRRWGKEEEEEEEGGDAGFREDWVNRVADWKATPYRVISKLFD